MLGQAMGNSGGDAWTVGPEEERECGCTHTVGCGEGLGPRPILTLPQCRAQSTCAAGANSGGS